MAAAGVAHEGAPLVFLPVVVEIEEPRDASSGGIPPALRPLGFFVVLVEFGARFVPVVGDLVPLVIDRRVGRQEGRTV